MQVKEKQNFDAIDVARLVFCLFVVGIHCAAFSDIVDQSFFYYLQNCVFRLAVPSFFVISGYFFGRKTNTQDAVATLKAHANRLMPPFVFWQIINVIIEVLKQLFIHRTEPKTVLMNILQSIAFYPYGALWYVGSLLLALLIVTIAIKKRKLLLCTVLGLVLYLIGMLANTYYFVAEGTFLQRYIDGYLRLFVSSRNALFVGLFFVSAGALMARKLDTKSEKKHRGGGMPGSIRNLRA